MIIVVYCMRGKRNIIYMYVNCILHKKWMKINFLRQLECVLISTNAFKFQLVCRSYIIYIYIYIYNTVDNNQYLRLALFVRIFFGFRPTIQKQIWKKLSISLLSLLRRLH